MEYKKNVSSQLTLSVGTLSSHSILIENRTLSFTDCSSRRQEDNFVKVV